jgi:hypothetical protein
VRYVATVRHRNSATLFFRYKLLTLADEASGSPQEGRAKQAKSQGEQVLGVALLSVKMHALRCALISAVLDLYLDEQLSLTWRAHRNDAGLAAAEVALAVEAAALGTGVIDTVATTGVFEIKPGAVNSVPREARLGIGKAWLALDCLCWLQSKSDMLPCLYPFFCIVFGWNYVFYVVHNN